MSIPTHLRLSRWATAAALAADHAALTRNTERLRSLDGVRGFDAETWLTWLDEHVAPEYQAGYVADKIEALADSVQDRLRRAGLRR